MLMGEALPYFLSKLELEVQLISTPHNKLLRQTLVASQWLHTVQLQHKCFPFQRKVQELNTTSPMVAFRFTVVYKNYVTFVSELPHIQSFNTRLSRAN